MFKKFIKQLLTVARDIYFTDKIVEVISQLKIKLDENEARENEDLEFLLAITKMMECEEREPKEFVLGFGKTAIEPMCSVNVVVSLPLIPFVKCIPRNVIIPHETALSILVTDIKVGCNSQLISTGCLPGIIFSDRFTNPVNFKFNGEGSTFTFSCTNKSDREIVLTGAVTGLIDSRPLT